MRMFQRIFFKLYRKLLQVSARSSSILCVSAVVLAWLWWYCRLRRRKCRLPPGPIGWPVIGYYRILNPNMYLELTDMKNKYGEVCSFYIGSRLTVVLNSHRSIREAFINQAVTFAGRPHPWVMQLVDVKEVINNGTYTEKWRYEKKFLLSAFRRFGYGSSGLDLKISAEISRLMNTYTAAEAWPLDPRQHMSKAMANLIFSIMINESYDYDDPELEDMIGKIRQWQEAVGGANILDLFPVLRFLPRWKPLMKLKQAKEEIFADYLCHVERHVETFDPNHCRDVIDVYLKERDVFFGAEDLVGLFFSVTGDAVDSLPETMVWMMLYLAAHPNIQDDVRKEIRDVTQNFSRPVEMTDKADMPYTEATIMECLRMSTFVPLSEPHHTLEDTELLGYHIPKGCNVLANIYAAHSDVEFWGDPETFRPERFLDERGRITRPEAYMPFSEGRRKCLADQLASKVMFLFTAALLQKFHVTFPEFERPDLEPVKWYNRKCQPFRICAIPL